MDHPAISSLWTTSSYFEAGIKFSGATKLADSAVAPLVAQARGYETIDDHEGAKRIAGLAYTTKPRPTVDRLKTMTNNGHDFLVIPWYNFAHVKSDGIAAKSASTQVRPSLPIASGNGKAPKYETLPGHTVVIDLNPAVPREWLDASPRVMITEGAIKGDSALTAQLLAAGVSAEELAAVPGIDTIQARARLANLLARVPEADRVPVLSLVGVSSWKQNTEWTSLNLKDRQVLVAFDGDIREKQPVWQQADRLFDFLENSKKASPKLLDLGGNDAQLMLITAGIDKNQKVGVDDFLSKVGKWADLLRLATDELPPQPQTSSGEETDFRPGDWRISPSGVEADRFKREGTGDAAVCFWEYGVVRLGGRIASSSTFRTVTDPNVEDGAANKRTVVRSGGGEVIIEVTWMDESGVEHKGYVRGPQILLSQLPQEWAKTEGTEIDPALTLHPDWPPRGLKGEGWMSAVKANQPGNIEVSEGWDTMGYVPSASGHPVFIVGQNVIGSNEEDERANHPGVTEETLAKSSFYGVRDTWKELGGAKNIDKWRKDVATNLREVVDAFTNGQAFRNKVIGPILLASALRPTAPISTIIQLVLSGGPGSGKSWSASFAMGFWQSRAGVWSETQLPGSASDTFAAIEYARARTPIWVVDDVAPGGSRQDAERMGATVENSIRQGFNRAGKRRSSADGKQQKVSAPRALTIYTAENQFETLSIRQRAIDIAFGRGEAINDGAGAKVIEKLRDRKDNPLSALTAAMIRFWMNLDIADTPLPGMRMIEYGDLDLSTWAGKHQLAKRIIMRNTQDLQAILQDKYGLSESESSRRAIVYSEIFFTLDVLYALGLWAGLSPADEVLSRLDGDPTDPTTLQGALAAYAAADLKEFKERSNSRSLIEAIQNILRAGKAHLTNPVSPSDPPFPSTHWNHNSLNTALGWRMDPKMNVWVPMGRPIGQAGQPIGAEPDEWIANLHAQNAFMEAQDHNEHLVPHGQKHANSWRQVWEDEDGALVSPHYKRRADDRSLQVKVKLGEHAPRQNGIPLRLEVLLDNGTNDLVKPESGANAAG
jgi:hypothetical protein